MSQVIFDLNENCLYYGVISAHLDFENMGNGWMPMPKNYLSEVFGLIWKNKENEWNFKYRVKHPTGNKQIFSKNMGVNSNEEECLNEIYKFPMKNKFYFKNPSGKIDDLLKILEKEDLILSRRTIRNET